MVNPVKGVFQKIKEWGQASANKGHRASTVEEQRKSKPQEQLRKPGSKDTLAPHPQANESSSRQQS